MKFLKKNKEKSQAPRQMDEIQREYTEVCSRLGQAEYQLYVITKDAENLKHQLLRLNQEAAARNQLDKANPPKAQEAKNDQP